MPARHFFGSGAALGKAGALPGRAQGPARGRRPRRDAAAWTARVLKHIKPPGNTAKVLSARFNKLLISCRLGLFSISALRTAKINNSPL